MKSRIFTCCVIVCLILSNSYASLVYNFNVFNSNQYEPLQLNFYMDVALVDQSKITFDIHNSSMLGSSIAAIYFDDNESSRLLSGIIDIANSYDSKKKTGVYFTEYATPSELPGANLLNPYFVTTTGLSADAEKPAGLGKFGIDSGENLMITFGLESGKTLSDVVNYLRTGDLRIGIHVGSLPKSVSAVNSNEPQTYIPEPASMILLGAGWLLLRKKKA